MPIRKGDVVYLTTEEAADFLGVSRQTVNRMAKNGELQRYKPGIARTVYYKQSDLEEIVEMKPVERDDEE